MRFDATPAASRSRIARSPKLLALIGALIFAPVAFAATDDTAHAEKRWRSSPHGPMLERILPPTVEPARLPEPASAGARLTAAYCVQCHYLPNPSMHEAERWSGIVERMVWRMEGKGNMGTLMQQMMAGVKAPSAQETALLSAYLQKHAQKGIDAAQYPELDSRPGRIYAIACSQCHVLPDPRRHSAREWPRVVERMERNMQWANRVVGDPALRTQPVLDRGEILRFLQRHAR